nr:hypothetical protein CFP56_22544 [Quercus suber]
MLHQRGREQGKSYQLRLPLARRGPACGVPRMRRAGWPSPKGATSSGAAAAAAGDRSDDDDEGGDDGDARERASECMLHLLRRCDGGVGETTETGWFDSHNTAWSLAETTCRGPMDVARDCAAASGFSGRQFSQETGVRTGSSAAEWAGLGAVWRKGERGGLMRATVRTAAHKSDKPQAKDRLSGRGIIVAACMDFRTVVLHRGSSDLTPADVELGCARPTTRRAAGGEFAVCDGTQNAVQESDRSSGAESVQLSSQIPTLLTTVTELLPVTRSSKVDAASSSAPQRLLPYISRARLRPQILHPHQPIAATR